MPKLFVAGSYVVGITFGVSRAPAIGETLMCNSFDFGPGGKGTNQAIGAARLGAQVDVLACLGDDLFGEMALQLYQQEGLQVDHIHQMDEINTGLGVVNLLPSGENWIIADFGANLLMTPEHVNAATDIIKECDIVLTQCEVSLETVDCAMKLGRKYGAMTIWNPAPAKAGAVELLTNVDLLTPNETEARILLGLAPDDPTPTIDLAQRLLGYGTRQVVVTLGADGALIVTSEGYESIPAIKVEAVDTTGAGDAFNAALSVGLGDGLSLSEAVRQANFAGAFMATRLGVIDGLATRTQLNEFIESSK